MATQCQRRIATTVEEQERLLACIERQRQLVDERRRKKASAFDTLAAHVDGHAPGVRGRELNAYASAGIRSDHEAYTAEEGRERLRAGMWLLIREASAARNLHALLPLLAEYG